MRGSLNLDSSRAMPSSRHVARKSWPPVFAEMVRMSTLETHPGHIPVLSRALLTASRTDTCQVKGKFPDTGQATQMGDTGTREHVQASMGISIMDTVITQMVTILGLPLLTTTRIHILHKVQTWHHTRHPL